MSTKVQRNTASIPEERQAEQNKLLKEIQHEIVEQEADFDRTSLYTVLIDLLHQQLNNGGAGIRKDVSPDIPWDTKELAFDVYREAANKIKTFRRSHSEGTFLFTTLRDWVARQ